MKPATLRMHSRDYTVAINPQCSTTISWRREPA